MTKESREPFLLMILDGWGINSQQKGNAVYIARTPYIDDIIANNPHTKLACSGKAVGLPDGVMGNSEVGHMNIGAGRIVYQNLLRINKSIKDGDFFQNQAFLDVMVKVKKQKGSLHLMGLLSDGGVHSHINHLKALIDMAYKNDIKQVYIHAILDGRDTPPDSGIKYVKEIQDYIDSNQRACIATVCGRFYAMDRDTRWERTQKAYELYTKGYGNKAKNPLEAINISYKNKETDEFVKPITITDNQDNPIANVKDNDGIIFFNFRADRARQITKAFTLPDFDLFKKDISPKLSGFTSMTMYDEEFDFPVAFPPMHLNKILGEVISHEGLSQLRIAETEKYAHVTYFFNGGEEKSFPLEDRALIPSPRDIPTYDLKPEMSALKITQEVLSRIDSNKYDLIVLNFANMDMVGHTGNLNAAIQACEVLDSCIKKVVEKIISKNGTVIITADHGNAEQMIEPDGSIHTAHTLNPVPLVCIDAKKRDIKLKDSGIIGDIAPTILELMGIDKPEEMTGASLIINRS